MLEEVGTKRRQKIELLVLVVGEVKSPVYGSLVGTKTSRGCRAGYGQKWLRWRTHRYFRCCDEKEGCRSGTEVGDSRRPSEDSEGRSGRTRSRRGRSGKRCNFSPPRNLLRLNADTWEGEVVMKKGDFGESRRDNGSKEQCGSRDTLGERTNRHRVCVSVC